MQQITCSSFIIMNLMEDERLQRFFEIIRAAAITGEDAEERKFAEIGRTKHGQTMNTN